jgi:hypothetical protein
MGPACGHRKNVHTCVRTPRQEGDTDQLNAIRSELARVGSTEPTGDIGQRPGRPKLDGPEARFPLDSENSVAHGPVGQPVGAASQCQYKCIDSRPFKGA